MKFEWEEISEDKESFITFRAKVHGGWLIKDLSWFDHDEYEATALSTALTFISDPNHEWSID